MPGEPKLRLEIDDALNHVWNEWLGRASQVWSQRDDSTADVRWETLLQDRTDEALGANALPNSLQSAEALLCILLPHWSLPDFDLSDPLRPSANVTARMWAFGGSSSLLETVRNRSQVSTDSQLRFLSLFRWYFETYSSSDAQGRIHDFSVGSYLTVDPETPDPERIEAFKGAIEVTDAYTFSVTLCLIVKQLMRQWASNPDPEIQQQCQQIDDYASDRLTSALLGLCDSFCAARFNVESWTVETSTEWPASRLNELRARLNRLLRSSGMDVIQESDAFECGWTWGRVQEPLELAGSDDLRKARFRPLVQPAQPSPYFYFTLSAIDGIVDLFSPSVETSELLTAEQMLLSSRLKQLWDISSQYWATVASSPRIVYGKRVTRRWSVQLPPWSASDGDASDYGSVALSGILIRAMADRRMEWGKQDVVRLTELLEELTQRAQINREPVRTKRGPQRKSPGLDPSVKELVVSGRENRLFGTNLEGIDVPLYLWSVLDFVPQLLKRVSQLMALAPDSDLRRRLEYLADEIWELHMVDRLSQPGGSEPRLWDDPSQLGLVKMSGGAADLGKRGLSWYMTERVCEAAVAYRLAQIPSAVDPGPIVDLVEVIRNRARYELADERHRFEDQLRILDEAQSTAVADPLRSLAAAIQALGAIWQTETQAAVTREMSR
jgi:hypothetical protein